MKFSDAVLPLAVIAIVALGAYFVMGDKMIQHDAEVAVESEINVAAAGEDKMMDEKMMDEEGASSIDEMVVEGSSSTDEVMMEEKMEGEDKMMKEEDAMMEDKMEELPEEG